MVVKIGQTIDDSKIKILYPKLATLHCVTGNFKIFEFQEKGVLSLTKWQSQLQRACFV